MCTPRQPLVSIITVVYNGRKHMEGAILSVLNQSWKATEYIIIDGASTDGTKDIIRQYEKGITAWISEKDNGIYDAMNKGIRMCKGEIIGILNSDDLLLPKAVETVAHAYLASTADIYYGKVVRFREVGGNILEREAAPDLKRLNKTMSLFHPATFITARTYQRIGMYDASYRIASDYDFLLRALLHGCRFHYIDEPLSRFRATGGVSALNCLSYREAVQIHLTHHTGNHNAMRRALALCILKTLARKIVFTFAALSGLKKWLERRIEKRWSKPAKQK